MLSAVPFKVVLIVYSMTLLKRWLVFTSAETTTSQMLSEPWILLDNTLSYYLNIK